MTSVEKTVDAIIDKSWGRLKQFIALVALGMVIGYTT